jgi:hypothetical protein
MPNINTDTSGTGAGIGAAVGVILLIVICACIYAWRTRLYGLYTRIFKRGHSKSGHIHDHAPGNPPKLTRTGAQHSLI